MFDVKRWAEPEAPPTVIYPPSPLQVALVDPVQPGETRAHFGRAQFLISPADLQAGRFTRACGFFTRY